MRSITKKRIITAVTVMVMALTVFAVTPDNAQAASAKYWLKVNTQANVVNVYKKSGSSWKPLKVMLCSCGAKGHGTPKGNYSIKKKWRWQHLFYGVSGQYVSQFKGNYLFHSVVYGSYGKNSKCIRSEYNKLGKNASHGCVRLATVDARWIYENCSRGTKVTIYKSSKTGPLGKPKKVAMAGTGKYGWDPTDTIKSNKKCKLAGPTITISKTSTIEVGDSFKIKSGVKAKSPYTFQNLTSSIKVASVKFKAEGSSSYKTITSNKVDTSKAGTYKIKYTCYNKYCGRVTASKTFTLTVKAPPEPEEPAVEPEVTDPTDQDQPGNPAGPSDQTSETDQTGQDDSSAEGDEAGGSSDAPGGEGTEASGS